MALQPPAVALYEFTPPLSLQNFYSKSPTLLLDGTYLYASQFEEAAGSRLMLDSGSKDSTDPALASPAPFVGCADGQKRASERGSEKESRAGREGEEKKGNQEYVSITKEVLGSQLRCAGIVTESLVAEIGLPAGNIHCDMVLPKCLQ